MPTVNMHSENNLKIEMLFAEARTVKNFIPPTGHADIVPFQFGVDATETEYLWEIDQGEFIGDSQHIRHGVDFSVANGLADWDMHFCNRSANTGIAKFTVDLWHKYAGRTFINIAAPDATYDFQLDYSGGASQNVFAIAYSPDVFDLSSWQANRSTHDSIKFKLRRWSSAQGDTLNGMIGIEHKEIWFPSNGLIGPY